MLSKLEETQLQDLISEAIVLICRNTVRCDKQIAVKALVGLKIDHDNSCMIDFNKVLYKAAKSPEFQTSGNRTSRNDSLRSSGDRSLQDKMDGSEKSKKRKWLEESEPLSDLMLEVENLAESLEHKKFVKELKVEPEDSVIDGDDMSKAQGSVVDEFSDPDGDVVISIHENRENETKLSSSSLDIPDRGSIENKVAESTLMRVLRSRNSQSEEEEDAEKGGGGEATTTWVYEAADEVFVNAPHNDGTHDAEEEADAMGDGVIEPVVVVETIEGADEEREENAQFEMVIPQQMHQVNNDGHVVLMDGLDVQALKLMPGEVFEYNGSTYQIEASNGLEAYPMEPKKKSDSPGDPSEVVMRKGNHTKSSKPKNFMCAQCSQCFTTNWGLKLHERLHNRDFRYKCKLCDKGFMSSNHLKGHMVKHSQQKEFACEYCGKDFSYRQSLERHQMTTNDNAPCRGLKKNTRRQALEHSTNDSSFKQILQKNKVKLEHLELPSPVDLDALNHV